MDKKRKFGDEILYITLSRDDLARQNSLKAIFYKGIIKGILEMDNGTIYYFVEGQQFDVYRKINVPSYPHGLQQIHSVYCFDNPDQLLSKVKQIFKK
jgi:hypothetical protein